MPKLIAPKGVSAATIGQQGFAVDADGCIDVSDDLPWLSLLDHGFTAYVPDDESRTRILLEAKEKTEAGEQQEASKQQQADASEKALHKGSPNPSAHRRTRTV